VKLAFCVFFAVLFFHATAPFPPDYTYQYWWAPTGVLCNPCPTNDPQPAYYEQCQEYDGTGFAVGVNVSRGYFSPPDPTTLNASVYGLPGPTHGCSGTYITYWNVTCFTCFGAWYSSGHYLCWQVVWMVNCTNLEEPRPSSNKQPSQPSQPSRPQRKGRAASLLKEHYEKTSERYDREEYGPGGGGQAAWQARVPENVRNFYARESYAAVPATASNWSSMMYLLMALTFGVVIGVGSYVLKKVQKRSEYVPLKEPLDKDNLLLS